MKDLIEALTIFLKYGNPRNPSGCSHDEFRIYTDPGVVSDEDKVELERLGFNSDEGSECFYSFRYGSA